VMTYSHDDELEQRAAEYPQLLRGHIMAASLRHRRSPDPCAEEASAVTVLADNDGGCNLAKDGEPRATWPIDPIPSRRALEILAGDPSRLTSEYAKLYQQLLRWERAGIVDVWRDDGRSAGGHQTKRFSEAQIRDAASLVDARQMAAILAGVVGYRVTRESVLTAARQGKISSRPCGGKILFSPEIVVAALRPEGSRDDARYRPIRQPGERESLLCSNPRCTRGPNGTRNRIEVSAFERRNYGAHFCSRECKYETPAAWNKGGGRKGSRTPPGGPRVNGRAEYWSDQKRSAAHREKLRAKAKDTSAARSRSAKKMDRLIAGRVAAHNERRGQTRGQIAAALRDAPGRSNRSLAGELRVDPRIVGIVRYELERDGAIPERLWGGRKQTGYPSYQHPAEYTSELQEAVRRRAHGRASTNSARSQATREVEQQVTALWSTEMTQMEIAHECHVTSARIGQIAKRLALPLRPRGRPRKK
jgi:hypothetical protein